MMQSNRINHRYPLSQVKATVETGFTLIELMISMSMGLIILLGMMMMFTSDAKVASTLASRTERLGDLYLASQIMQANLRGSTQVTGSVPRPADLAIRNVSLPAGYPSTFSSGLPWWDETTKTMTYQDQDGNTGIFQYQRTSPDRIYWLRPDASISSFAEMLRDLNTTSGMSAFPSGSTWQVTLVSAFKDENRQDKTMQISFKVWARN